VIPHSRATLGAEDAAAVARVVAGGHVAQGPEVLRFERAMADRLGVETAAAVSSGTAALELALRALGVQRDDEVIIPTFVCDALWHAVQRAGAVAVLADADPATLSLSVEDARRRCSRRTRAAVVPHAFGRPVAREALARLDVPVVEDCAQTVSASHDAAPVGTGGAVAICSFYATKLFTTGEGGMIAGPSRVIERARAMRQYDERPDLAARCNAKLTDMAASLGLAQLARLDGFIARRRAIAARYRTRLGSARCVLPPEAPGHVYHRFVVQIGRPVDAVLDALAARGVVARRPVFRPLHAALGGADYPEADRLWATSISLPCYPTLTDAEVDAVAAALRTVLDR
jgi:dTDP-4-amino-4,6-dideoxygalactose transaminase